MVPKYSKYANSGYEIQIVEELRIVTFNNERSNKKSGWPRPKRERYWEVIQREKNREKNKG